MPPVAVEESVNSTTSAPIINCVFFNNLQYPNNTVLLAGTPQNLQALLEKTNNVSKE